MATRSPLEIVKDADKAFIDAVLKNLKLEAVRGVITVPLPTEARFPEYDEYADYRNVTSVGLFDSVRELGSGVATLYNALITNATHSKQHKVVTDLFAGKNLKFNVVLNDGPYVADPAGPIEGWVSFRFHFKSSNDRPESLSSTQHTLSKIEAR